MKTIVSKVTTYQPGFFMFLGFEKSAEFVRKRLAEAGESFSDSDIFEPFHSALLDLFRRSAWRELGCQQTLFWK